MTTTPTGASLERTRPGWPVRFTHPERIAPGKATFRAVDRDTGRQVVIKELPLAGLSDWKHLELFEREFATLESLDHPSIPKSVGYFVDPHTELRLLVMEHVDGVSLSEAMRAGRRLSKSRLRDVLMQLLQIADYLHEQHPPVIHRDIKPDNILECPDGRLVLVDFGAVARSSRGETTVGTFGYMAPEQLHGESSPASDLYAIGMTILALASGQEPEALPRLGLEPDVSSVIRDPELAAMVRPLVATDPRDRPRSVKAALVAGDGGAPSTRALAPTRAPGRLQVPSRMGSIVRHQSRLSFGEWTVLLLILATAISVGLGVPLVMASVASTLLGVVILVGVKRRSI